MFDIERSVSQFPIEANQTTEALQREVELLSSIPSNIGSGVKARAQEVWDHKLGTGMGLLAAAGLGALLAASASRNPATAIKVARFAPKVMGALTTLDIGSRFATPMIDTWRHPDNLAVNKALLGKNLGSAVVDYSVLMGGGAAMRLGPAATKQVGMGMRSLLPKLVERNWQPLLPGQVTKGLKMFVPQTKAMLVEEAPSFYARPKAVDLGAGAGKEFGMQREFQRSDDWVKLYTELFPPRERLSVEEIMENVKKGTMALHVSRNASGQVGAFSITTLPNPARNLKSAHLDYLGVDATIQSKGLGSMHMRKLNNWTETAFPEARSTTFFIESRSLEDLNLAMAVQRERRAVFYNRLGAEQVGYPKGNFEVGQEPVEIWAFNHGQQSLNKSQALTDGQRRFIDAFAPRAN